MSIWAFIRIRRNAEIYFSRRMSSHSLDLNVPVLAIAGAFGLLDPHTLLRFMLAQEE